LTGQKTRAPPKQAAGISPTGVRGSDTLSEKPELFALSQTRGKRLDY